MNPREFQSNREHPAKLLAQIVLRQPRTKTESLHSNEHTSPLSNRKASGKGQNEQGPMLPNLPIENPFAFFLTRTGHALRLGD